MSKTPLFAKLRRIALAARARRASQRPGPRVSRRELSRAALGLAAWPALGCSDAETEPTRPDPADGEPSPRVAVVGAGLAGLHCAYRLDQAGAEVMVYEASSRTGGRTFTGRDLFAQGQTCELGGELIDGNHRFMFALAEELDLTLDDRFEGDYSDVVRDTWFVGGRIVPEEEITRQFSEVVDAFADAVEAADEDDEEFARLDGTNLEEWLDATVPADVHPELRAVLGAAYVGEFGLELVEQSCLNLIYLIGSDDPDPFRIFGDSDERYHLREGSDAIATRLAERLGPRVVASHVLTRARRVDGRFELDFETPDGSLKTTCDRLVFALPFTKLREVDLDDLALSAQKRRMIDELGYGTNAKVMGAFRRRVWLEQGASGTVTSDLALQQTWDSSVGQEGRQGILTNFLGGERGAESGKGSEEAWFTGILDELDGVFPGVKEQYVEGSAVRMHWPSHPHTLGSYSCYRPGQWEFWGTEGVPERRVHFCGEHTSPEFQGWMEGAAETGGRVAIEVLTALGLSVPKALRDVADADTALPDQDLPYSRRFPRRLLRVRERTLATLAEPMPTRALR